MNRMHRNLHAAPCTYIGVLPEVNLKFGNKQMAKKDKRFKFIRIVQETYFGSTRKRK